MQLSCPQGCEERGRDSEVGEDPVHLFGAEPMRDGRPKLTLPWGHRWVPQRSLRHPLSRSAAASFTLAPASARKPTASHFWSPTVFAGPIPEGSNLIPFHGTHSAHGKFLHGCQMVSARPLLLPCLHMCLQPVFHCKTIFHSSSDSSPMCPPKSKTHKVF